MLSKRLFKVLGYRLIIMELGYCTPFNWDSKRGRLCRSSNYSYWNFCVYIFYLSVYGVLLAFRLAQKTILQSSQIFGEDEVEEVNPLEPAIRAIDIGFIGVISVISCVLHVIQKWKDEMITFFNDLIEMDETLEEMFKIQLKTHPTYKQTVIVTEFLIGMTCISTLLIPPMFGLFFLQDAEPLHRFFAEVLEVKPRFDLPSLPLVLFVVWSILQCCNVAGIFIMISVLYMKFLFFWMNSFQPKSMSKGRNPKKFLTQLGYLEGSHISHIYRTQQALNTMFNQFMGNRFIAVHQAGLQIVVVVTSFVCIRYFTLMLFTPGYQLGFIAVGLGIFIEFVETKIITDAIESSHGIRVKVKNMMHRNDLVVRVVGNAWNLKIDIAHPYFQIGRDTFMEFMNKSVELLVDLLMAE